MGEDEELMGIGPQSKEFADLIQTPDHEETDEEDQQDEQESLPVNQNGKNR